MYLILWGGAMIKYEVTYEKNGNKFIEEYNAMTVKQLQFEFNSLHMIKFENIPDIKYRVLFEFDYVILNEKSNKPIFKIKEKTKTRALSTLKRIIKDTLPNKLFLVKEIYDDNNLINIVYSVGESYISTIPDELPCYLKNIGKWKQTGKYKFIRIS